MKIGCLLKYAEGSKVERRTLSTALNRMHAAHAEGSKTWFG